LDNADNVSATISANGRVAIQTNIEQESAKIWLSDGHPILMLFALTAETIMRLIVKHRRRDCAPITSDDSFGQKRFDHKIPKARGGGDGISNLQWLCEAANLAKRDLTDAEFVTLCEDVIRWLGERIELVESVANETEVAA